MRFLSWILVSSLGCMAGKDGQESSGPDASDDSGTQGTPAFVDPEGALSAGHSHSCGLNPDGTVVCWGISEGDWDYGQVSDTPAGSFLSVSVGGYFSCGVRTSGWLHDCWGEDKEAPGVGSVEVAYINVGVDHACAITTAGNVLCWGDNMYGETIVPAGGFTQVSAGYRHTCGIRDSGTTTCWGRNQKGQGSPPDVELTQISAGAYQTCGIDLEGALHCWGETYGYEPPTGTFVQLSASRSGTHACALDGDGQPHCWGYDEFGQASAPDEIFDQISAGGTHSCGRTDDGTFTCWGNNIYGQATAP